MMMRKGSNFLTVRHNGYKFSSTSFSVLRNHREFSTTDKGEREVPENFVKYGKFFYPTRTVEEVVNTIDTTLTPEQKTYVEKLKKMIKGGVNSPKCEC